VTDPVITLLVSQGMAVDRKVILHAEKQKTMKSA